MPSARDILASFTLENIPTLDVAVRGALELFAETPAPRIGIPFMQPLIVGSGNAEAAGRIMFERTAAFFASESTVDAKLASIPTIDGVVVVSASGGKHAPLIAKAARAAGKRVALVTCNPTAPAMEFVDPGLAFVFPKNREPYTYNTSTYMGMILGATGEDPRGILRHLDTIDSLTVPDFSRYQRFFLIVPPRFEGITRMVQVKFTELFGRLVARDVETSEYMKHAVTVVPSDELFVSFGEENTQWGESQSRVHVPLPEEAGYATMMAVSYYLVGKIQSAHPPHFSRNIVEYCLRASQAFGSTISPIVE